MFKLSVLFLIFFNCTFAQVPDTISAGFWNLENLFDTYDDPLKDDAEYLPSSEKAWDSLKLDTKLQNLAEIIKMMDNGESPDILGVCEVENKQVLHLLTSKYLPQYSIAHLESPDNRGIDNALLYNSSKFLLLSETGDTVTLDDGFPTRLIFQAALKYSDDTIFVFVNHWPSRRAGESESEKNRIASAKVLRNGTEKLLNNNPDSRIIIMGDFNDEPSNISLIETLGAAPVYCESGLMGILNGDKTLFNLAYKKYEEGEGTYNFQKDWNMLDQIIVSRSLLSGDIEYLCGSFEVSKFDKMITQQGRYKDTPRPTFGGKNYLGGYSDHFPVISYFIRRAE
jgi:endonuclease/exonuclease/phosphatase family metal-dependent hydrolase